MLEKREQKGKFGAGKFAFVATKKNITQNKF